MFNNLKIFVFPFVYSTRIRLARNLKQNLHRKKIFSTCAKALFKTKSLYNGILLYMESLDTIQKQILFERHLISNELCIKNIQSAVVISHDLSTVVMINEEDHLRIQSLSYGYCPEILWKIISTLDTELKFLLKFGYLTSGGTGMRISMMVHLPCVNLDGQINHIIQYLNCMGLTVRGFYGEFSTASANILQISNQQNLGKTEIQIFKIFIEIVNNLIKQERHYRNSILRTNKVILFDKIGRSYGILKHAHVLSLSEAMKYLSFLRLAVDLEILPKHFYTYINQWLIESQTGHLLYNIGKKKLQQDCDTFRAEYFRKNILKWNLLIT